MSAPYFFGYGSLVNCATHDFPNPQPAQLTGWRRVWRHTDLRPVAFLSIVPDPNTTIDGLIAHVPHDDWAALDQREWAYDRIPATNLVRHPIKQDIEIAVYAVPEVRHGAPSARHPVLLSYVDVVVQGYLREFGSEGAARFFATTDGWDAPILNDRTAPRYPRHQQLTTSETAFVDENLAAHLAHITNPD
jgi:Gamma-glutamyl cyclotransferase, AIG2-like